MTWHHFSGQAQYFRQMEWKNRKTHWYEAVSSALNFPFLKEVSPNCFVFQVEKLKMSHRSASFLMLSTLKNETSRRIASFLTLPSSNIEEVS